MYAYLRALNKQWHWNRLVSRALLLSYETDQRIQEIISN
jgi:hypothetical protein